MRAVLINTGTELLLGDVQDAHLAFIAREIFPLGVRIEERRTVPDTEAIQRTLAELFPCCEILFLTGGLGPTSDDITREMVAEALGLELREDPQLLTSLQQRLQARGIKWTPGIARQADVPEGAQVLPNENGSAPGFYLKANINPRIPSPHLFVLPGPPRELQPMFMASVLPILHLIVQVLLPVERRIRRPSLCLENGAERERPPTHAHASLTSEGRDPHRGRIAIGRAELEPEIENGDRP